jgi:hypothetical protein
MNIEKIGAFAKGEFGLFDSRYSQETHEPQPPDLVKRQLNHFLHI